MSWGVTSVGSAKTVLLGDRLVVLTMGNLRQTLLHSSWCLSIYGGHPGYNLQEGRYTSCPLWMEELLLNLELFVDPRLPKCRIWHKLHVITLRCRITRRN